MITHEPRTRLFSRQEYYSMAEMGWFGDQRVELIEGEIIEMSPPLNHHARMVTVLSYLFTRRLPAGYFVFTQNPILLGQNSDPQPDVAVIKGTFADLNQGLPTKSELVVEVSESSLSFDRRKKGSMYAKSGIKDYWIINLNDRVIEVHRDPVERPGWYFGYHFESINTLAPGDTIAPLSFPDLQIAIAELWD